MSPATRRRSEAALLVLGGVGLVGFGYVCLSLQRAVPQVDPSQRGHGVVYDGSGLDRQWLVMVVISSVTMVVLAGLPGSRSWSARGSVRGAFGQAIGGVVICCWAAVTGALVTGFYFMGPDDGCTYPSCWPLNEQRLALLLPGVLTGVVMLVLALLVRRLPWTVRAFTPVVVWVAVLLTHYWIWTTHLLPAFKAPPG